MTDDNYSSPQPYEVGAIIPPGKETEVRESPKVTKPGSLFESPHLWQELYLGWDRGRVVLEEETLETVNPQSLLFLVLGLAVGGGGVGSQV